MIYRPEYSALELDDIETELVQPVLVPPRQIDPLLLAATLSRMFAAPVCLSHGFSCSRDELEDLLYEEHYFDDIPREFDSRRNIEAFLNYVLDVVNPSIDRLIFVISAEDQEAALNNFLGSAGITVKK